MRWLMGAALLTFACVEPQDVSDQVTQPEEAQNTDEIQFDLPELSAFAGDLQALFERTRRAFRDRDGRVLGGDSTVGVEVDADEVRLTPYHWETERSPLRGEVFSLRTHSIVRGATHLNATSRALTINSEGIAELGRSSVTEHIANVKHGIEQSWRFAERPSGNGALTVRIAYAGHLHTGTTDTGLHFEDPLSGIGFRYGHGTWIGADGARYPVPAIVEGTYIVLSVPDTVLEKSAYPALLDPLVTAEYGYDNPINGAAVNNQLTPDAAYSGVAGIEYMVVWADYRRETSFVSDVFGARVSASGVILDPVGIHIPSTNTQADQLDPVVAWGDDGPTGVAPHWFVAWEDHTGVNGLVQLRGRRFDSSGTGPAPDFDVTDKDDSFGDTDPDITFSSLTGGSNGRFLVTWTKSTGGIQGRIFTADTFTTGNPQEFNIATHTTSSSSAVSGGDSTVGFYVVWDDDRFGNRNIFGRTVSASTATGTELRITPDGASQTVPGVGFAAGSWIVAWEDLRNGTADIYGQRLDSSGALAGGNFVVSAATGNQMTPAVVGASNSSRWFVIWTDTRNGINDLYGARLSLSAGSVTIMDPSGIPVSAAAGVQAAPSVTYNSVRSEFVMFWSDYRSSLAPDIYGTRVRSSDGVVLNSTGFLVSKSDNQQSQASVASCAGKYLVVWTDTRNGFDSPDIYGAITNSSAPPTILVNNMPISVAAGRQELPDVSCNGTDFFVVWADERNVMTTNRDIYGTRVRASDGVVLDPAGLIVTNQASAQTEPAIAYLNGVYQVVWSDARNGSYDVYGKRVSSAGVVDNPSELNVSGAVTNDQVQPTLSYDQDDFGTNQFLVVWQDGRNITGDVNPNWDIYGRYLGINGLLSIDLQITTSTAGQYSPSVATRPSSGLFINRFQFVVYEHYQSSASDILGTTVFPGTIANPTPSVGATINVAATAQHEVEPDVAWRTSDQMTVAFRRASPTETFDFNLYGQDVDVSPLSLVNSVFNISTASDVRERSPALICSSATHCQIVYRRYSDANGVDRMKGRVLTY